MDLKMAGFLFKGISKYLKGSYKFHRFQAIVALKVICEAEDENVTNKMKKVILVF